jgi:predicted acetyltransferase
MLFIVAPDLNQKSLFFEMCKDYLSKNEEKYQLKTMEEVEEKIDKDIQYIKGIIPEGHVQYFSYWFIEKGSNKIIGTSRLRPKLIEELMKEGGNIGYDVRPSYRKMGYGTEILRMTIKKARENGLEKILITCDDDNIGSRKIIEKNNGKFENKIYLEEEQKWVRRYWIE